MKVSRVGLAVVLLLTAAVAQRHRDPLTQAEIAQVRDTSWEPKLRLPLYVEFARARLVKLEQLRIDPKTKDRVRQTHDLLDDFQLLYDELNDNIETYVDRHDDIRKPLKLIIDADTEFEAKLRALKDAANVSTAEAAEYEFVLTNAIETVDSATEDHRKLLSDQEEQAKRKQLNKNPSKGTGVSPE
ncbi:MAG TPA: hypothetical protein VE377_10275 [Candidatus Dormibacteraeota bacterium]|nr:hypothetical protein [Candidatus Dormibacteraeota bacterium]